MDDVFCVKALPLHGSSFPIFFKVGGFSWQRSECREASQRKGPLTHEIPKLIAFLQYLNIELEFSE